MRRSYVLLIPALLALGPGAGNVHAQQRYPTKSIRLIVPFAPGGGTDLVARVLAQKLGDAFGVPVVVDNRAGAAGTTGTESAVRANPDGYTMIMVSAAYATNAALYKLPYDAVSDVTPIALVAETGLIVTGHPSLAIRTVRELVAHDKAHPGSLNYGSSGAGGTNHLATELFNQTAGTRLTHLPYKGTSLAMNDLLGGHIQLVLAAVPLALPHVRSNRLRGIAVTTAKRSGVVPDIPTVAESVPGYEAAQWFAFLGPKALPREIVARWNGEIDRILKLPEVRERLVGEGVETVSGSPERFRELLRHDVDKWRKVIKTAGIRPGN